MKTSALEINYAAMKTLAQQIPRRSQGSVGITGTNRSKVIGTETHHYSTLMQTGEIPRHVDRAASRKTGQLHLKRSTDERQREQKLIVDISDRMNEALAYSNFSKIEFIKSLASHLAHALVFDGERLSLYLHGIDSIAYRGQDAGINVEKALAGINPASAASSFGQLLQAVQPANFSHESLIVFSDFYDSGWEEMLGRLQGVNRRIVFIHVMDPADHQITEEMANSGRLPRVIEWTDDSGHHVYNLRKQAQRDDYNAKLARGDDGESGNEHIWNTLGAIPGATVIPVIVNQDVLGATKRIWQDPLFIA